MSSIIQYASRVFIAISVLFNTITGGVSNQTFSARNYQWKREGRYNLVYIIDKIWYYETNHCMISWVYWRVRKDVAHEIEMKTLEKERSNVERYEPGDPHGL